MKHDWNKHDIEIGDVFYLHYYGINLFFRVGATDVDGVYIYELATKKDIINDMLVDILVRGLKPSRRPWIVPQRYNSWTHADYFTKSGVDSDGKYIVVTISYGSPLHKAVGMGDSKFGTMKVYQIDFGNEGPYAWYWPREEFEETGEA